jgi:hypothetical protein
VDPAFAIQLLKKSIIATSLGLKKIHPPAPMAPMPDRAEVKPGIPAAPPRSV